MLADYFTKLFLGSLFSRLREFITGCMHVDTLQNYAQLPKKEHVKNHVSGDEPEIYKKETYSQIITGNHIIRTDGS